MGQHKTSTRATLRIKSAADSIALACTCWGQVFEYNKSNSKANEMPWFYEGTGVKLIFLDGQQEINSTPVPIVRARLTTLPTMAASLKALPPNSNDKHPQLQTTNCRSQLLSDTSAQVELHLLRILARPIITPVIRPSPMRAGVAGNI